jgi:malate synthase
MKLNLFDLAMEFLKYPRTSLESVGHSVLLTAIELGQPEFITFFLERSAITDEALETCVEKTVVEDRPEAYSLLRQDPRQDTSDKVYKDLRVAIQNGSEKIVKLVLSMGQIDPTQHNNLVLTDAIQNDVRRHSIIESLLEETRIFNSATIEQINLLLSQPTTVHEKQLAWKWLLTKDYCSGILRAFDVNRQAAMSMHDLDNVITHFANSPYVTKLVKRKVYARRILLSLFRDDLQDRSMEGVDMYEFFEMGFLQDREVL